MSEDGAPSALTPADSDRAPARRGASDAAEFSRAESLAVLQEDYESPPAWPIYLAALVVSVLWVCGPLAFAIGYRNGVAPFRDDLFAIAVFALLSVGPAAFVWIAAYMVRQTQKLGAETRRAKALADDLIAPVVAAGLGAGDVVQSIREEIRRAGEAADDARVALLELRKSLSQETERLAEAAATSLRNAQGLSASLGLERTEMGVLAQSLDAQAAKVADVISQQARMVAEASDLAETQLREAEALLAARAADLAAAAGEAQGAARTAGEDLNRHIARLENAGIGVAEQIRAVEGGLAEQRASLVTLSHALRADNEAFATEAEGHAAQLADFIGQARISALEMGDRALKGGESLRHLMAEATAQFRDLTQAAQAERDAFSQSSAQAVGTVFETAAKEREQLAVQTEAAIEALARAAEETRAASSRHAEAARDQVDQLSEAAFTAGQKANQAFEARLDEARQLIERSAEMVEQAGTATAEKLEAGASAARATLEELQRMLADVDQRSAQMPLAARDQAEQVRVAVTESMDELLGQARRAAEETQAIDAAFQERVRRNYEMLSEAVRLMGAVASGPVTAMAAPAMLTPPPPPRTPRAAPEAVVETPAPARAPEPKAESKVEPAVKAEPGATRPRLRLTPTATDEEFSSVFEASGGADAPDTDGWTWKELLSSIDESGPTDPVKLEAVLIDEIAEMGIDATSLLPPDRIEKIAAVIQTGDLLGAREVVRKLAPAAVHRLSRRLLADERLGRQTARHLDRYKALLDDAAARDHEGFLVAALLNSDGGRAYLVLEAAVGDMA
ncbi:MAG: polar localization protein TipN [Phenylobacterium sp.]|uniref:polar localization protein TipN n=1 Tax=Phenylobacterium sp. TaxID=1871053 RepID=UPI002737697E|nr:polar localization protein TipN [Phenylobacterium sp.]MDP3173954.1 polar localization protein TipN [Phenylobacterium sp.]